MTGRSGHGRTAVRTCALAGSIVTLTLAVSSGAVAAPADPHSQREVRQPSGKTLMLRAFGDEHGNGVQTRGGYTVVRDAKDGAWEYARKGTTGRLTPSGRIAGEDAPPSSARGLTDTSAAPPPPDQPPAMSPGFPSLGVARSLVILAQFANQSNRGTTSGAWSSLFFGASPSVRDFYAKASYGQFDLEPAAETSGTVNDGVVGWVTLPENHPDVLNTRDPAQSARAKTAIGDAIQAASASVDFAAFDTNGDGYLEPNELHVTVIMAGYEGAQVACGGHRVWAHMGFASAQVDGVFVGNYGYTTFGEMQCAQVGEEHQATIGVIAHELGHDLGWPDLYDTDKSTIDTDFGGVGYWSLMSRGTWNAVSGAPSGSSPAMPDAFSRYYQGWVTPTDGTGAVTTRSVAQAEGASGAGTLVRLLANPNGVDWSFGYHSGTGEYFLVENRQKLGYDAALPGCGLLIWHIDETRPSTGPNDDDQRRMVFLMRAGNGTGEPRSAADAWLGARTFDDSSTPNSRLYSGASSGVTASAFSATCGATMSAQLGTTAATQSTGDAFGAAADAASLPYTRTGVSTVGAGVEADEPQPSCAAIGKTVWVRYRAPAAGTLQADTTGSSFDTVLGVYRGTSLGALTEVACNDDIDRAGGNLRSSAQFGVEAGQTYYVQLGGFKDPQGAIASGSLSLSLTEVVTPPADDAFADALAATPLPFTATGIDTRAATVQTGEPAPSCRGLGKTAWLKFTPATSGTAVADTVGSDFDTVLAVHRGTALGALTEVGCNDDIEPAGDSGAGNLRSRVQFAFTAGQTYYLQIGGYKDPDSGEVAAGRLTVHLATVSPAPPNDSFAQATVAVPPFTAASLDTRNAGIEGDEHSPSCAPLGHTVWFRYTPSADGTASADTVGSDFDTVLGVWRGTSLAGLTEVACSDDIDGAGGNRTSRTEFAVQGGQTYYIQAGGYADGASVAAGSLTLSLKQIISAPANDTFGGAVAAAPLPFRDAGADTRGATEAGEPVPACANTGKTVWYRYAATADTTLAADTSGSTFDTVLAVYRGTSLGSLAPVGCADDIDRPGHNLASHLEFAVTAGQTYYVQAGGFKATDGTTAAGTLTFALTAVSAAPAGDEFATATTISALPFTAPVVETSGAGIEAGEGSPSCAQLGKTVWFRYVPPTDATIQADTAGSDFDTVLAVWRGSSLAALTQVACNDDIDRGAGNLRSRAAFAVTAGQTYMIQVGGFTDGASTPAGGHLAFALAKVASHAVLSSGPADGSTSTSRSASFAFAAAGADGFECRLDGGAWTPCTSPRTVTSLGDGQHTFEVRAITGGTPEVTPAKRTWTVDATPPDTRITGGPAEGSAGTSRTARIEFSSEPGASFACRTDGAAWRGCGSPLALADLADGPHRVEVRATDEAGNVDPTPASRGWNVDATAPDTIIVGGPADGSSSTAHDAAFAFTSESGATFECRLDAGTWAACASPQTYAALADGRHAFAVRARDALGNTDATPAERAWTIGPAGGGGGGGDAPVTLKASVGSRSLTTVLRRGLSVEFACTRPCRPSVTLQLAAAEARRLRLGRKALAIGAAKARRSASSGKITVRLKAAVRRALRRQARVRLTVTVRLDGKIANVQNVTLRR